MTVERANLGFLSATVACRLENINFFSLYHSRPERPHTGFHRLGKSAGFCGS